MVVTEPGWLFFLFVLAVPALTLFLVWRINRRLDRNRTTNEVTMAEINRSIEDVERSVAHLTRWLGQDKDRPPGRR
jgi:hypothetical protein